MTLNEYQKLALRTAPPRPPVVTVGEARDYQRHDLLHAAMGMASEAGELINVVKREHAYGKLLDWVNMSEEAGDMLWFIALYCRAAGVTLEQIAEANIAKLRARYPEKFTQEAALNRNVEGERVILETLSVGTGINHPV